MISWHLMSHYCIIPGTSTYYRYHLSYSNIISYHTIAGIIHSISYHTRYNIVSHRIVSYHMISYHMTSYHAMPHHTIPYRIISYNIIQYHITGPCTMPYHTIHTISYHIISFHILLPNRPDSSALSGTLLLRPVTS